MAGEMRYCSAHVSSPWYHEQVLFLTSVYCTLKRRHVSMISIIDNDSCLLSTHLMRDHAVPGNQWIMLSESKYKQSISQHVCPDAYTTAYAYLMRDCLHGPDGFVSVDYFISSDMFSSSCQNNSRTRHWGDTWLNQLGRYCTKLFKRQSHANPTLLYHHWCFKVSGCDHLSQSIVNIDVNKISIPRGGYHFSRSCITIAWLHNALHNQLLCLHKRVTSEWNSDLMCEDRVLIVIYCLSMSCKKNNTMHRLSRLTVFALIEMLFLCLVPSLFLDSVNKHQTHIVHYSMHPVFSPWSSNEKIQDA